jgi:hypothetical protein
MSGTYRDALAGIAGRFQVGGSAAALDVSDDDPVVDYGAVTQTNATWRLQ